jgi:hypothetical protein
MEHSTPAALAEQAAGGWGAARPRSIGGSAEGMPHVRTAPNGWNRVKRPSVDGEDPATPIEGTTPDSPETKRKQLKVNFDVNHRGLAR